jgi:hypothetical protein
VPGDLREEAVMLPEKFIREVSIEKPSWLVWIILLPAVLWVKMKSV